MKTPAVSLLLNHRLVLKFSEDPVMTGSDVTLYCEKTNESNSLMKVSTHVLLVSMENLLRAG
ncbi:hypothetical protein EXN66_Car014149 [Channa argus]|uniref:Uncharacterized protein n=1 Tax=Channa argus TaxID=215402 RepID=A0A6G1Q865_CHAAH|nr:hypothetical protein EXN66_Car014149 [Channa argus]